MNEISSTTLVLLWAFLYDDHHLHNACPDVSQNSKNLMMSMLLFTRKNSNCFKPNISHKQSFHGVAGVVDGERGGGNSERCLKWGCGE